MSETKTDVMELTSVGQKLAKIERNLPAIDEAAKSLRSLTVANDGSVSVAIRTAAAIEALRELLTPEVMRPIMCLQNTALGFKTDNKAGYAEDVVRDCVIIHLGRGGTIQGNQMNIIASNSYQTKEYFQARLDEVQGRGRWYYIHGIPKVQRGKKMVKDKTTGHYREMEGIVGAILETEVRWLSESGKWQSEKLTHCIKGDEYSTSDAYNGKADRKCGAWLLARVTGMRIPDADADDVIEVQAQQVDEMTPADDASDIAAKFATNNAAAQKQTEAKPTEPIPTIRAITEATGIPQSVFRDYAVDRGWTRGSLEGVRVELRKSIMENPDQFRADVNAWVDAQDNKQAE